MRPARSAGRSCPVVSGNAFPEGKEEDERLLPRGVAVLTTAMVEVL